MNAVTFINFFVVLICILAVTSKANPTSLEKRSDIIPYGNPYGFQLQQEREKLSAEFPQVKTSIVRYFATDLTGGNYGRIWIIVQRVTLIIIRIALVVSLSVLGLLNSIIVRVYGWINSFG